MKKMILVLSCALLSTQLRTEHTCRLGTGYSWAECDTCKASRHARSLKAGFDLEWDNQCEGRLGCNEDDSELIDPV